MTGDLLVFVSERPGVYNLGISRFPDWGSKQQEGIEIKTQADVVCTGQLDMGPALLSSCRECLLPFRFF